MRLPNIPDMVLWSVDRSKGPRLGRGPRLRWLRIARRTDKMVFLFTPHAGRIAFKRSELNGKAWHLYESAKDAIAGFLERAEWWLHCAEEEAKHAQRDIAFATHRGMVSILRFAQEQS